MKAKNKIKKLIAAGDRFMHRGDKYLVCRTGHSLIQLIKLDNGNRWNEGATVVNVHDISPAEWERIVGRFYSEDFVRCR
jgi:hypothetical protein